jgi:hypothetical protein
MQKRWRQHDGQRIGINGQQAQIKERVKVAPEDQAVAEIVCVHALIWDDVRGFERLDCIAA